MKGVHDLGGMQGFGPVQPEPESEEPVFHEEWESRVYGIVPSHRTSGTVEHRHVPPQQGAVASCRLSRQLLL